MANESELIRIDGLRELRARLKALDNGSEKNLRLVLNEAADIVVAGARKRAPVRSGNLQKSIKASSTGRTARVSGGSAKVPYFGFIDYGGRVGPGRNGPNTGSTVRPFIKDGRIMYPAYYADRKQIITVMAAALDKLIRNSGLEVDGG